MRKILLTSAALLGVGVMLPAFAQTPSPATQTPPAATPADTGAPSDAQPATETVPPRHHHHLAQKVSDTSGQTWAHQPGTGESGPASTVASNIDSADSRSAIAPHFPTPAGGDNASPERYLQDAEHALETRKTGVAQQALEMAETRLLDRSTPVGQANQPDQSPEIQKVSEARQALGHGNVSAARAAIQTALAAAPKGNAGATP
jgi:hypothetical protein